MFFYTETMKMMLWGIVNLSMQVAANANKNEDIAMQVGGKRAIKYTFLSCMAHCVDWNKEVYFFALKRPICSK